MHACARAWIEPCAKQGARVHYPEPALCTDNGAMIALAGAMRLQRDPLAASREQGLRGAAALAAGDGGCGVREIIENLPASKIREVANAGIGRSDVLAFWFGESDEPTPQHIRAAATRSIEAGETFYAHNLGLPELREAIAGYASALHRPVDPERIAVTSSGVNALMVAMQALAGAGDEVAVVVPVWPNLTAQPEILGAVVKRIAAAAAATAPGGSTCGRLLEAVTPATRVLLVNAPNNPTGWTLTADEQREILAHCRRTGTWIVADEVYERIWFGDRERRRRASSTSPSPTIGSSSCTASRRAS